MQSQNGKHPNLQTFNGCVILLTYGSFTCGYGLLSKRKMSMFRIFTITLSNSTMTYTLAPTHEQRLKASPWTKKVRASSKKGQFNNIFPHARNPQWGGFQSRLRFSKKCTTSLNHIPRTGLGSMYPVYEFLMDF